MCGVVVLSVRLVVQCTETVRCYCAGKKINSQKFNGWIISIDRHKMGTHVPTQLNFTRA